MALELNKGVRGQKINEMVVLIALSQRKEIWNQTYTPPVLIEESTSDTATATATTAVKIAMVSQKPNGVPLTFAEQAVAQAFKEKILNSGESIH